MTRFASPLLIECPHCQAVLAISQLSSLNTSMFGGLRFWTDGETNNPYAHVGARVGCCPFCQTSFWNEDAKKLGEKPDEPKEMGRWEAFFLKITGDRHGRLRAQLRDQARWNGMPEAMKDPTRIETVQLTHLMSMLALRASLPVEREAHLRRQIWRAGNDHSRRRKDGQPWREIPALDDEQAKENILALVRLYETQAIASNIEYAELLRHLGRFDDALAVLNATEKKQQQSSYFQTIYRLAQAQKVEVKEVV